MVKLSWFKAPHSDSINSQEDIEALLSRCGVRLSKLASTNGDEKLKEDFVLRFDITLTDSVTTNLPPGDLNQQEFEEEMARFSKPHFHYTDEIRFIKEGSCYIDIRTETGVWVRTHLQASDVINIPAGLVHSVGLDAHQYVKASGFYKSRGLCDDYIPRYECDEENNSIKVLLQESSTLGVAQKI